MEEKSETFEGWNSIHRDLKLDILSHFDVSLRIQLRSLVIKYPERDAVGKFGYFSSYEDAELHTFRRAIRQYLRTGRIHQIVGQWQPTGVYFEKTHLRPT
ncbi:hypothetical protein RvY_08669 [Ramazzottius varieornatus]|uniref:Uncharacterized protein n=1 Tax=Ramazzottius varieornatus TaxID=947166 RepID=A0A1D1VEN2_RAMVA|nr:hypothetical protein RvY_08669 [Ramazzottius varieornatus]